MALTSSSLDGVHPLQTFRDMTENVNNDKKQSTEP